MRAAYLVGTVVQPAPDKDSDGFPSAGPHPCPQKLWTGIYFSVNRDFVWAACFAGIALQPAPDVALAVLSRGRYTKLST